MRFIRLLLIIGIAVFSMLFIVFASNFASYVNPISDNASDIFNNRDAVSSFSIAAIMGAAVCVLCWLLYKDIRNR